DPPSPGSAKRDPLVAHEGHRVDERLAAAHDEVQVAAGGVPGGADACDELAGADLLTDVHADAARHDVRVAGVVAVAVLDADVVAPRAVPARVDDGAGVGRVDRDAAAAREVDARVVGARAVDGVDAPAEVGGDASRGGAGPSGGAHLAGRTRAPLLAQTLLVVPLGHFATVGEEGHERFGFGLRLLQRVVLLLSRDRGLLRELELGLRIRLQLFELGLFDELLLGERGGRLLQLHGVGVDGVAVLGDLLHRADAVEVAFGAARVAEQSGGEVAAAALLGEVGDELAGFE